MAGVIKCSLMGDNPTLKVDGKRNRTYTHSFLIECDTPNILCKTVLSQAQASTPNPLPGLWDAYDLSTWGWGTGEVDAGSFLQEVELKRHGPKEKGLLWVADLTWKALEPGQSAGDPFPEDPLDMPIMYQLEWANYTKTVTRDKLDRLIANSAGDLFEDVQIEDGRPVLVAVKNEYPLTDIITKARFYKNAINSATFFGADPHTAKLDPITSGQLQYINELPFYAVTYRVQFTEDGETWDRTFVNKGNMAYANADDPTSKRRVIVLDGANKGSFRDSAYLAHDGTQLPEGDEPLPIPADADVDGPFQLYTERDFAGLGIGG